MRGVGLTRATFLVHFGRVDFVYRCGQMPLFWEDVNDDTLTNAYNCERQQNSGYSRGILPVTSKQH